MAEVRERTDPSGIKLFGTTISVRERSSEANDHDQEESRKVGGGDDDQTAEKRADKIIPCPRCKSMETKFCYFNNYNVNQPRHFCRGCQRYWTAGGALRNVPIGAGRRKTKPPCRGMAALAEGCLFDAASGVDHYDDGVEEWGAAEHGGFERLCPAKRRRCGSNSQTF